MATLCMSTPEVRLLRIRNITTPFITQQSPFTPLSTIPSLLHTPISASREITSGRRRYCTARGGRRRCAQCAPRPAWL
jgi:hypothetical protein